MDKEKRYKPNFLPKFRSFQFNYSLDFLGIRKFSGTVILVVSILWGIGTYPEQKEPIAPDNASNISAKSSKDNNSIEITWTPPAEEGEVILARSRSVIDTPEKLFVADSLGIFSYKNEVRIREFKDINLRPGQYYYAVALVNSVRRRQVTLLANENFTTAPATIFENDNPKKEEVNDTHFIRSIDAQKTDTGVKILWEPPDSAVKTKPIYSLYRSTSPLNTVAALRNAKKLIELDHPDNTYTDRSRGGVPGVYYGVSVTVNGEEHIPLMEGRSFTKYGEAEPKKQIQPKKNEDLPSEDEDEPEKPNKKKKKPKPSQDADNEAIDTTGTIKDKPKVIKEGYYVHEINYELKEYGYLLTWSPPTGVPLEDISYGIYQSTTPLKNVKNLLEKGTAKLLGETLHPTTRFNIPKEDRKKIYYYGVTVRITSGEEYGLLEENDSFLKVYPEGSKTSQEPGKEGELRDKENPDKSKEKPEEKADKTKENPEEKPAKKTSEPPNETESDEFNRIMSDYYKKGKFTVAHEKLILLAETSQDPKEKGKAYFYAALCQYNKKKYKEALKLLLRDEVQKNYEPDRVEFYINQCLKQRRDG